MPYELGRRSRQTSTFMLDPDVRVFDEVLAPRIDGIARWTTEPGEHEGSLMIHRSLGEALESSGIQAFLQLEGEAAAADTRIQYLATDVVGDSWTGPRVHPETPDAFIRAGRLAYVWFPEEEPVPVRARFSDLERLTWKALNSVTTAHLIQPNGKPARSTRIGLETKKWVVEHPSQQLVSWGTYMRLR